MVADRQVRVAELAGGAAQLEHRRLPVGGRRVDVQVAANVRRLDRHALDGDADDPVLVPYEHRDDLRQPLDK